MSSLLIDDIDNVVEDRIGLDEEGLPIEFNTDFRYSILFEEMMQSNSTSKEIKVYQALKLYYPTIEQIIHEPEKAINNILWFYRCGKDELANSSTKQAQKRNIQIYSYEFDDNYIYSAFLQQYGIDLQKIEYLHWWKFKALFDSLSNDTKIVEIMGYRSVDLGKIKDKSEKKRLEKLKKIYALPDMRTEEEKEADIADMFW